MRLWKKKEKDPLDVSKEALLLWREQLIKTAYAMRVAERIISRYTYEALDPNAAVKQRLDEAWSAEEFVNSNEIWATIGNIENILMLKHGVSLLNALDLHQLRLSALDHDITKLELKQRDFIKRNS